MPKISSAEYYAVPLRAHTFLENVPLHDVWAVDLPRLGEDMTLAEFQRRAGPGRLIGRPPPAVRALLRLRFFLGRVFRLDVAPGDAGMTSFASRLTRADRAQSFVEAGTRDGPFRVVYRFENEQLVELHNQTAHAATVSALAQTASGYRFYFAVYVVPTGWITPLYMALIDPFRNWIVYPALLRNVRALWANQNGP